MVTLEATPPTAAALATAALLTALESEPPIASAAIGPATAGRCCIAAEMCCTRRRNALVSPMGAFDMAESTATSSSSHAGVALADRAMYAS